MKNLTDEQKKIHESLSTDEEKRSYLESLADDLLNNADNNNNNDNNSNGATGNTSTNDTTIDVLINKNIEEIKTTLDKKERTADYQQKQQIKKDLQAETKEEKKSNFKPFIVTFGVFIILYLFLRNAFKLGAQEPLNVAEMNGAENRTENSNRKTEPEKEKIKSVFNE